MRPNVFAVLFAAFLSLNGCANLSTVHRSLNLGDGNDAKAIAIDGYQLPIFSQKISLKRTPTGMDPFDEAGERTAFIVCPNPPVEAISGTSLSAAITNSFKAGQRAAGIGPTNDTQAALASAVAAASIGLRTNSTTLLSYSATANCLAYMGGATHDKKYMELARRNQHITLAILAIEQLTGVAQAGQATLNGGGNSATGSENLAPLQKSLDDAIKDRNAAKLAAEQSLDDVSTAERDRSSKAIDRKNADAANQLVQKDAKAEAQTKADAKKAFDDADQAYQAALTAVTATSRVANASAQEVIRTDSTVKHAQTALELAERAVRAQVTASATVGQGQGPRSSATADVARAVVDVVKIVTTAIGEGESCAAIIEDFRISDDARLKNRWSTPAGQAILQACAVERAAGAESREVSQNRSPITAQLAQVVASTINATSTSQSVPIPSKPSIPTPATAAPLTTLRSPDSGELARFIRQNNAFSELAKEAAKDAAGPGNTGGVNGKKD